MWAKAGGGEGRWEWRRFRWVVGRAEIDHMSDPIKLQSCALPGIGREGIRGAGDGFPGRVEKGWGLVRGGTSVAPRQMGEGGSTAEGPTGARPEIYGTGALMVGVSLCRWAITGPKEWLKGLCAVHWRLRDERMTPLNSDHVLCPGQGGQGSEGDREVLRDRGDGGGAGRGKFEGQGGLTMGYRGRACEPGDMGSAELGWGEGEYDRGPILGRTGCGTQED